MGHILEPFNFIDSDVTLLGHGGIVFHEILKLSSEEIFQILKILIVFVIELKKATYSVQCLSTVSHKMLVTKCFSHKM